MACTGAGRVGGGGYASPSRRCQWAAPQKHKNYDEGFEIEEVLTKERRWTAQTLRRFAIPGRICFFSGR